MTPAGIAERLAAQPRTRLAMLPTALEDAVRLRDALGGPARCPRILVKRDDLTAVGLGGNASGSRGTQAGLTVGRHLARASYELYGVAISGGEPEKLERARRVAREAARVIGADDAVTEDPFFTDQSHIGEGYAIPTAKAVEALLLVARTEALVLDLTYTAKAMGAGGPATMAAASAARLARTAGWDRPER